MRRLLPLLLLALLAPRSAQARSVAPAPAGVVRVGAEAGAAWYSAFPDTAIGWSGTLRARADLTSRFMVAAAVSRLGQHFEGLGRVDTTLLPLTLDLRLDRAPLAPFFGGGVALLWIDVADPALADPKQPQLGGVFEAGLEWFVNERLSLTAQVTYAGLGSSSDVFPFFSTAGAGVAFSL